MKIIWLCATPTLWFQAGQRTKQRWIHTDFVFCFLYGINSKQKGKYFRIMLTSSFGPRWLGGIDVLVTWETELMVNSGWRLQEVNHLMSKRAARNASICVDLRLFPKTNLQFGIGLVWKKTGVCWKFYGWFSTTQGRIQFPAKIDFCFVPINSSSIINWKTTCTAYACKRNGTAHPKWNFQSCCFRNDWICCGACWTIDDNGRCVPTGKIKR